MKSVVAAILIAIGGTAAGAAFAQAQMEGLPGATEAQATTEPDRLRTRPDSLPAPSRFHLPDWRQSHLREGDPAVNTLYRVSTCLALRHTGEAETLLATTPGTVQEAAAFAAIMSRPGEGCLAPTRRLTLYPRSHLRRVHLVRGAIAESLLRMGPDRELLPLLPTAAQSVRAAGGGAEPLGPSRGVALCAAILDPARVYELLQFNPSSPGEYRELRALAPTLEACLAPGPSLDVDRLTMRVLLAESLHRVAHGSVDPAAEGGE